MGKQNNAQKTNIYLFGSLKVKTKRFLLEEKYYGPWVPFLMGINFRKNTQKRGLAQPLPSSHIKNNSIFESSQEWKLPDK